MSSKKINIFLPVELKNSEHLKFVFENNSLINKVFFISTNTESAVDNDNCILQTTVYLSSNTFNKISLLNKENDFLFITEPVELAISPDALHRFVNIAIDTAAGIVTSNHSEIINENIEFREVLNYHSGSVRDDFYFGPLIYFSHTAFEYAVTKCSDDFIFAGLYDIRLHISEKFKILNIPENLYSFKKLLKGNGTSESHFNYVDPKNRDVQTEMEKVFTSHLSRINAIVKTVDTVSVFSENIFEFEMSVIIPVKNRVKTIQNAVDSALQQKTDFPFNIIIVDNHSTDGTTDIIRQIAQNNKSIIHIIPGRNDLGIGGCWNEAIHSVHCGKYSVQLDSDDLYRDESTLQKIVGVFRKEKCAMVIGSYIITDFNLQEIPPGLIDHKEWTDDNGMNNALRINGLGAPRAFYTPLLREIKFPNVSYGEDYSIALRISAEYKVGRIYEPIYICRRWEGNSDHNISHEQQNKHNVYKDFIRLREILTRQKKNHRVEK